VLDLVLLTVLLAAPADNAPAETRTIEAAISDAQGVAVTGLVRDEVVVIENGLTREVTRVEPDDRPLSLVLLVDTSQAAAPYYRLYVVDAVLSFLRRLPEGTHFAVWTTGDRPFKAVDFTTEVSDAEAALKRVAPQGGNTVLDALVEASRDLKKREGQRSAVVAVTTMGVEFSNRPRQAVVEQARGNADTFSSVVYEEGLADSLETRLNYEYALDGLAKESGGLHESTLSAMGLEKALAKIGADLRTRWRISYATLADLKRRKLEIRIARPGMKVRIASEPGK
jgi:VWFA-related protein